MKAILAHCIFWSVLITVAAGASFLLVTAAVAALHGDQMARNLFKAGGSMLAGVAIIAAFIWSATEVTK